MYEDNGGTYMLMIKKIHLVLAFLPFFLLSVGMAGETGIGGKALYLERMALPSDAVFEVALEDISLMDAKSITLGSTTVSPVGQVPIYFEIKFNKEDIKKNNTYSVRAKITAGGKLLYVTDTANLVFKGKDDSKLKLIMKRVKSADGTGEPMVLMQGMYQYMADAAFFKECITGRKFPVLFEKDNVALEHAYLKNNKEAGALLKIEVEGKIVQRPKVEGEGMQPQLLVERFIKTIPNETCGNPY